MLDTQAPDSVRLDQWLWAARFFRTRALARQAVDTGKVELAGQRPQADRQAQPDGQAPAMRVGDAHALAPSHAKTLRFFAMSLPA